jgi:hypothetical protein
MRILHRSASELSQNLVVTFLKKAQETEGLQMCTKHLQLIRGAMKLKTNMPPDVLQAHVKRCIELGENYTTLRETTESYSWFVGAKAPKNIETGTSEKEEVFRIPATQSVSFDPSTITRERICELLSDLDKTSLENFDATGIICIGGVFQHWKSHKDAEGEKSLKDIAAKEAAVYDFHAPSDRGQDDGWLGAMQFLIAQQALRVDLTAYLIALALRNDEEWRLTPFPTPARYITSQMSLDRLEIRGHPDE